MNTNARDPCPLCVTKGIQGQKLAVKSQKVLKITLSNQQFLPIKLVLKIHTANFLKCFTASQNLLCLLFNSIATQQLNSIFASVDTSVNSARELVDIISNNSLNQSEIIIGLAYVHLVLILYAFIILCYFRCCHL